MYAITVAMVNLIGGAAAVGIFWTVAPDEFLAVGATAGETTNLV